MAEPDSVDESLAVARHALRASAANKARVRALLDASRAVGEPRAAGARRSGFIERLKTPLVAGALVGSGFVVGYWLGRHPESDPFARGSAAGATASAAPAPVEPAAAGTRVTPSAGDTGSVASTVASEPAAGADDSPAGASPRATLPGVTPSAVTSPALTPSPVSSPAITSPARRIEPRAPRAASAASPADPFLEELALLARVDRAIRAGEPELALTLLAELEQQHPKSSLVEEREAARLLAGCLRREPDAHARAERFVRERGASVYVERVRSACGVGAGAGEPATPPSAEGSRASGH